MNAPPCLRVTSNMTRKIYNHNISCVRIRQRFLLHCPHPMSKQLDAATRTLVSRFQRQRPLRGGSLIITMFGDAIAPRGGAVTLGSLIALTQPFGLTERLVRTSVARLANEDWLVAL